MWCKTKDARSCQDVCGKGREDVRSTKNYVPRDNQTCSIFSILFYSILSRFAKINNTDFNTGAFVPRHGLNETWDYEFFPTVILNLGKLSMQWVILSLFIFFLVLFAVISFPYPALIPLLWYFALLHHGVTEGRCPLQMDLVKVPLIANVPWKVQSK